MAQCIKRLQQQSHKAKYPIFFDIQPLINFAFSSVSKIMLVDRVILQLRLTTLMRSSDIANVTWGLYTFDKAMYIKTVNKMGHTTTFNVTGKTLKSIMQYMCQHINYPAPYLIRDSKEPHRCLTAERIAKRTLNIMEAQGIDTEIFKAHSMRGATATHLMKSGTSQDLVQTRGGWSSSATLDQYNNRMHQLEDWEQRGGGCTAQANELDAHGLINPLCSKEKCPSCNCEMKNEASYKCQKCGEKSHVRCMSTQGVINRQTAYNTHCYTCQLTQGWKGDLIIDFMGVCDGVMS